MEKFANFLGFRQVTKGFFDTLSSAEKKNYLWFVRELESGDTKHAEIYFGTRKYGELNDDEQESVKLNNLIAAMGEMVDENGNWVGFPELEISGDTLAEFLENLVAHIDNEVVEAISAETAAREAADAELEAAISAETAAREAADAALAEAISAQTSDLEAALSAETAARKAADEELAEAIQDESALRAESDEVLSAMTKEVAERVDVLEDEISDLKSLGILHFVDVASAISGDTIVILMDGTEVVASSANTGSIYMIDKAEYASNGEKWVDLGDESQFAQLKEALEAEVIARQSGDAELDNKIDGLDARVDALESDTTHIIMGDDLEEYEEGEQSAMVNSQLSNVAANGGTALIQSDATLDNTVVVGE